MIDPRRRRANRRLALILASLAALSMALFVSKILWLAA